MSSGTKSASISIDAAAESPGWRMANALAIAAPYLLAGALFAFLYLQPAPQTAHASPPPPAPADDGSIAVAPTAPSSAPASPAASQEPAKKTAPAPPLPAPAPVRNAAASAASPGPAKAAASPTQPVSVDPVIARTMKLSGDAPVYPLTANMAHIQGVVVVNAVVGADGAVQSVEAVSGPALLEVAALNAVRSWRYRPWLVQGNPVPFKTDISIEFKLDAPPQPHQ